jgi:hypothetical protein
MEEQFENAINIIKSLDINACITGSIMLGYQKDWEIQQDIDVFVYNQSSFNKLLFYMYYHPLFQVLDPLEIHKMKDYIDNNRSSLESLGLLTIKFKYNTCVDVNIILKKNQNSIFDVISNFDLDIIATGYDIKTGKTLSLRETTGLKGTWNKWNPNFYTTDFWSIKRLLRQFERVIKYTNRGYDLNEVTEKYISIVETIIATENYYKSPKGTKYFNDTIDQFKIVLNILKIYQRDLKITPEELLIIQTII